MIIKVDDEGMTVMNQLLDIALKVDGLKSLDAIVALRNSITKIEPELKVETLAKEDA